MYVMLQNGQMHTHVVPFAAVGLGMVSEVSGARMLATRGVEEQQAVGLMQHTFKSVNRPVDIFFFFFCGLRHINKAWP